MTAEQTPIAAGYRWPAEWERHTATWLSWPHNRETWPGKFDAVLPQFTDFVQAIAEFEPVHILAGGESVRADAQAHVGHITGVTLHDIGTNDAWARDHGPTFLTGPTGISPALIDWQYNAWGGKYPPFDKDNAVPKQIAERLGCRRFAPDFILEGGAIDGNGLGTILTTESCLLNPNRNPGTSRETIERYLADYLGAKNVLWLQGGEIVGDDTDGHIDQLARFVNATTVVAATQENPADENHEPLTAIFRQLQSMTDQNGRPLKVIPLPMPGPLYFQTHRLPASYLNFYIANGVVIVPQFDDPADAAAVQILAGLFPDRQVRGLCAVDLVWGLGAFHCLSQQQPGCHNSEVGMGNAE